MPFSQIIADTICERLAGGESLRSIFKDKTIPSRTIVFKWLGENKIFQDQYARARESQADTIFDEILDIVDDSTNDWVAKHTQSGVEYVANPEVVARSRLRMDARKWMAGKLRPKKYGDHQQIALTGLDDGPVQTVSLTAGQFSEIARKIASEV